MTALTANRSTEFLETGCRRWRTFGVAADVIIFAGALVAINASGYLVPASANTTLKVVGVATAELNTTGLSNGAKELEVDYGIALFANSDTIATANVEDDCYVVDDQTVAKSPGGTLQITEATITFNGTDQVGLDIDGVRVAVACNTNGATTIDDWLVEFAKYDQLKNVVTPTDGTTKIVLTFKTPGKHNVEAYSPATADFSISHTTPGVAATRPRAGKVHLVNTRGVYVRLCGS